MPTAKELLEDAQDAINRWGLENIDLPVAAAMIRKEKEGKTTIPEPILPQAPAVEPGIENPV